MPSRSRPSETASHGCAGRSPAQPYSRSRCGGRPRSTSPRQTMPEAPLPNCSGRSRPGGEEANSLSLADEIPVTIAVDAEVAPAPARVLLVWDAPNLDMGLGSILGGRPTAAHRPRFDALGRWLLARTAELATGHTDVSLEPEATVFTNIAPGSADVVRPWVEALRNVGFAVFAKPKVDDDSDVDNDMLNHIALRHREGLAGVLVASADGQAFKHPLGEIARDGGPVQVLG